MTIKCRNYEWQCDDGQCIELERQCNGVIDCAGGEDEKFCTADNATTSSSVTSSPMAARPFICNDGTVLEQEQRCNGFPECDDGGDEVECIPEAGIGIGLIQEDVPTSLELASTLSPPNLCSTQYGFIRDSL